MRFPKPRFPRLSQFPFFTSISHLNLPSSPKVNWNAFIPSGVRGSVPRNFKDPSLDNQGDHLGEYRERAIGRAITGGRGCGSPIAPRGEAAPNEAEAVYAVQPLGTPALRHAPREPPRARVRKSGGARRGEREREREAEGGIDARERDTR